MKKSDREVADDGATAMGVRQAHGKIHETNYFETIVHLVKAMIGAGVFAMGQAIQNAGLLFGFGMTMFLGAVCTYNIHILIMVSQHVAKIATLDALPNFPETIEFSFVHGPPSLSKRSKMFRLVVKIYIMSTQLGFGAIYLLFVASTLRKLASDHIDIDMNVRIYILLVGVVTTATVMIRSFKFLAPISFIADCLLGIGIVTTITLCAMDGFPPISDRPAIANYRTWPTFLGTVMFAFEGLACTIPLHNEMKNPQYFRSLFGIINIGMFIVVFTTAAMGFIAYLKYGDDIEDLILLNLEKGPIPETIKLLVCIGLIFTYAIQFHVAIDVSWWDIVAKYEMKNVKRNEYIYRILLALFTIILALTVPYLGLFLSMIGSVFSTSLALIFPAISDISLRSNPDEEKKLMAKNSFYQGCRYAMDIFTILLGVTGMIAGLVTSVIDLYTAFKNDPYAIT